VSGLVTSTSLKGLEALRLAKAGVGVHELIHGVHCYSGGVNWEGYVRGWVCVRAEHEVRVDGLTSKDASQTDGTKIRSFIDSSKRAQNRPGRSQHP